MNENQTYIFSQITNYCESLKSDSQAVGTALNAISTCLNNIVNNKLMVGKETASFQEFSQNVSRIQTDLENNITSFVSIVNSSMEAQQATSDSGASAINTVIQDLNSQMKS